MPNVIRLLRSATSGTVPTGKTEGEPFYNEADNSFGIVDAAGVARDLIAIRHFAATAAYEVGDHVVNTGILYRNIAAIPVPGPWDPTDWAEIGAAGAPPTETDPLSLHLTGGTMTGQIITIAPVAGGDAANKTYVDGEIATLETDLTAAAAAAGLLYLPLTAGATKPLTGPLFTHGLAPVDPTEATDKQYVDDADADLQAQITVLASNLIFSGTIDVVADAVTPTPESGLAADVLPPAADPGNRNMYLIVTTGGTAAAGNIPAGDYNIADWLVSDGANWIPMPIGLGAASAVTAPNVTLSPDVSLWGNVQVAIEQLNLLKLDANSIIDAGTF